VKIACRFIITVQWPLLNDTTKTAKINLITSLTMDIIRYAVLIMSIDLEVMKLISLVLLCHLTVVITVIMSCSIHTLALVVHDFVRTKC